ncbi:MAG: MFS transporter, partial [Candidatus Limnocylindrales bacterium]
MTSAALDLPPSTLDRLRRRTHWSLVAGVALGSTGHIAASTVSSIAAQHIAGSTAWSGAPGAAVVLGAALGAVGLSQVMVRSGRRIGLALGYAIGVAGALVATLAVIAASLPLLLVGTVLVGFGNASNQLSRYVSADLFGPSRRASAIGIVVWGATVGAVIGPNLAAPAGALATRVGLPELAGAYLVQQGEASVFVSAGNTGAATAAAQLKWRQMPGFHRAAVASELPNYHGNFLLLDA